MQKYKKYVTIHNMPATPPNSPNPYGDKQFVDDLIKHMTQPCGTDAGNVRSVYIGEAERALDNNTITDPVERIRLGDALRMAKIFRDVENPS